MHPRCSAAAILFLIFATPLWSDEGWKAGVARANITPQQPMRMAGYAGRTAPAQGQLTDLWAKALVIEDAQGKRGLLITLDLVGIDRGLSTTLCDQLEEQFDLPRHSIAICVSHTHTGPVVGHNLETMHRALLAEPEQRQVDEYADSLRSHIAQIVDQAIRNLAPCQLRSGTGTATFAVNRRNNPETQVPALRMATALAGPSDHEVPVLAIRNAEDHLLAVVFGYACHATTLDLTQWSGDYPGYAQMELEHLHPDCQAMFWAGCGADQNPLPRRSVELAQHYGRRLADAVDAVLLTTEMAEIHPDLETHYAEIDLPLDTLPTREALVAAAASQSPYEQSRARLLLARIDAGEPLSPTYPYPIGLWQLGRDLRWFMLGGEVVVDYALTIKQELGGNVWMAGYANDVMAYIPSRRVLAEGGYEGGGSMVYYGLPAHWAPTIERAILAEVRRQSDSSDPSAADAP